MTREELIALCETYVGNKERFQQIVGEFIRLDDWNSVILAELFEVARSTVIRWAKGIARPSSRVRASIVRDIKKILT